MERAPNTQPDRQIQTLVHPLGKIVFCIHCFRSIGTESASTTREDLQARHKCAESLLAKQPAAPPPFN